MKHQNLSMQELFFIAGTRVALGAGLGFVLSERLTKDQRKGAGWALVAVGVISSVPILLNLLGKPPVAERPVALVA